MDKREKKKSHKKRKDSKLKINKHKEKQKKLATHQAKHQKQSNEQKNDEVIVIPPPSAPKKASSTDGKKKRRTKTGIDSNQETKEKAKNENISSSPSPPSSPIIIPDSESNNGKTILGPLVYHPSKHTLPDYTPYTIQSFVDKSSNTHKEYIVLLQENHLSLRNMSTGLELPFVLGLEDGNEHLFTCIDILQKESSIQLYAFDSLSYKLHQWDWTRVLKNYNTNTIIPPSKTYTLAPIQSKQMNILHIKLISKKETLLLYFLSKDNETISLYSYPIQSQLKDWIRTIRKHCENVKIAKNKEYRHVYTQLLYHIPQEMESVVYWVACTSHMINLLNDNIDKNTCHTISTTFHKEGITSINLHTTQLGVKLLVGLLDGRIFVYHNIFQPTKTIRSMYKWHTHPVQSLTFISNDVFVSGGEESVVVVWDGSTRSMRPVNTLARLCRGPAGVLSLVCSKQEDNLIVLGSDNTLTCIRTFDYNSMWKIDSIGIALGHQLMLSRMFILQEESTLQYNPHTNEVYLTSLDGVPGILQSFKLQPNILTLNKNIIASIHNRVSRKEQHDPPSLVPQIKYITFNDNYLILVECQYTTLQNNGLLKKYKYNDKTFDIYEIIHVHCYKRIHDSYEDSIVIPTPHGIHASISGITLGTSLFITCSQEESSFRIWDISSNQDTIHTSCRMKITTPMNMKSFIGKCCELSFDESVVVIGYKNHLTFWNVENGALVSCIPQGEDYEFVLMKDMYDVLLVSKSDSMKITSFNAVFHKTNWTYHSKEQSTISSYYYWKEENKLILSNYDTNNNTSTIIALNVYNGKTKSLSSHYYQESSVDWIVNGVIQNMVIACMRDDDDTKNVLLVLVNGKVIAFPCFEGDVETKSLVDTKIQRTITHGAKNSLALPTLSIANVSNKEDEEQAELFNHEFKFYSKNDDDKLEIVSHARIEDTVFSWKNTSSYAESFLLEDRMVD